MLKFEKKLIPNYLTILRLILVPIIFGLILYEQYTFAIFFYIIANLTDILDGFIARKFDLTSDFGKLMDPLADKITQISTILALIIKRIIPFWILIVFSIKEIIMIIVASVLYKKKIVTVHSKWYGKAATVLLFIAIFLSWKAIPIVVISRIPFSFISAMYGFSSICISAFSARPSRMSVPLLEAFSS